MSRERQRSSLARAGWGLLAVAALVVLFVGYQLVGTGIVESRQQASLRDRFDRSLAIQQKAAEHVSPGATPSAPPGVDPATGQPVGTLVIPSIGVDQVVVEGTGAAQLTAGPGHYPGTPLPGQPGNAAIAGHRTTYGHPFYDLDALVAGDPITVTTLQGSFHYSVVRSEVVSPSDVAVLAPSPTPELTLTTCTPRYTAVKRLVVVARLVVAPAAAATIRPQSAGTVGGSTDPLPRPAAWPWVAVWAVAGLGLVALVVLARRRLGPRPWLALVAAAPVALVVLFFFFGAVDALLPASF